MFIEVMHLLPQSFDDAGALSSSQGRLREQQHSSSQLLFGSFRKACRISSRGRFFRFWQGQPQKATLPFMVLSDDNDVKNIANFEISPTTPQLQTWL